MGEISEGKLFYSYRDIIYYEYQSLVSDFFFVLIHKIMAS